MKHLAIAKTNDLTFTQFLQKVTAMVDDAEKKGASIEDLVFNFPDPTSGSHDTVATIFLNDKATEGYPIDVAIIRSTPEDRPIKALEDVTKKIQEWTKLNESVEIYDIKLDMLVVEGGLDVARASIYYSSDDLNRR